MRKSNPRSLVFLFLLGGCGGATLGGAHDGDGGTTSSSGGSGGSGSSSSGSTSGGCSSGGGSSGSSSGSASGSSSGSSSGGSSTSSSGGGGADAGRIPVNHRTGDSPCSMPSPAGQCSAGSGGGQCTTDSACTQGMNGRCVPSGPIPGCICTYDICQHDTDCGAGSACACHGTAELGTWGNSCVRGNCRVDADCGPAGYCSPSPAASCVPTVAGYYCHTPSDPCVNDADCPMDSANPGSPACAYSTSSGTWQCISVPLCQ